MIRLTEKLKKVNRKELVKKISLIFIFVTFITVLAISKGETYLTYTDSSCEDYEYRQLNKAQCEYRLVGNILYDENGDIDLIVVFLFWISLSSIMVVIVFQKLTSEHVLSGKCMAKKRAERVIVPKINYQGNCIVRYILKRIGLELKNKISFSFPNKIGYDQWVCPNTHCSGIEKSKGSESVLSDATD